MFKSIMIKVVILICLIAPMVYFGLTYTEERPLPSPKATLEDTPIKADINDIVNISAIGSYSNNAQFKFIIDHHYHEKTLNQPWYHYKFETIGIHNITLLVDDKAKAFWDIQITRYVKHTGTIDQGEPNHKIHMDILDRVTYATVKIMYNRTTQNRENDLNMYVYENNTELKNTTEHIRRADDPQVKMLVFNGLNMGAHTIIIEYSAGKAGIYYTIEIEFYNI